MTDASSAGWWLSTMTSWLGELQGLSYPAAPAWENPFFCLLTLGTDPGSPVLLQDDFLVLSIFAA